MNATVRALAAAALLVVSTGCGGSRSVTPNSGARQPAAAPTPAPGTIIERQLVATVSPPEIEKIQDRFYVYENALPPKYAVDTYRVTFTSIDPSGAPIKIVGRLYVPQSSEPAELPVYVFGAGTTGIGDNCAPSKEEPVERSWGDFQAHLVSHATQGYVAIMPDYAGFNDDARPQYYYVADMHARVLLDAARAALHFFDGLPANQVKTKVKPASAVFFAGYSQGGHASYAARDAASRYAPELKVKGAIGYGPRGEVATMLKDTPFLAPYLLYSYNKVYGAEKVPLDKLILPRWMATFEQDVTTKCIDEVPGYYPNNPRQLYQPALADALEQNRLGEAFPALQQLFDQNNAGRAGGDIPMLVVEGLADTLVPPAEQQGFVRKACAAGAKVTYMTYPDIPHTLARQVSYRDVLSWMDGIMKGIPPRTDCGK